MPDPIKFSPCTCGSHHNCASEHCTHAASSHCEWPRCAESQCSQPQSCYLCLSRSQPATSSRKRQDCTDRTFTVVDPVPKRPRTQLTAAEVPVPVDDDEAVIQKEIGEIQQELDQLKQNISQLDDDIKQAKGEGQNVELLNQRLNFMWASRVHIEGRLTPLKVQLGELRAGRQQGFDFRAAPLAIDNPLRVTTPKLSPDEILQWIEANLSGHLKVTEEDMGSSIALDLSPSFGKQLKEREEAVAGAIRSLSAPYVANRVPLVFSQGGPGCGKTAFTDLLARKLSEEGLEVQQQEQRNDEEGALYFQMRRVTVLPVAITFNSLWATPVDTQNYNQALAARMLYFACMHPRSYMPWDGDVDDRALKVPRGQPHAFSSSSVAAGVENDDQPTVRLPQTSPVSQGSQEPVEWQLVNRKYQLNVAATVFFDALPETNPPKSCYRLQSFYGREPPRGEDLRAALQTLSFFSMADLCQLTPLIRLAAGPVTGQNVETLLISDMLKAVCENPLLDLKEGQDPLYFPRGNSNWTLAEVTTRRKLMFQHGNRNRILNLDFQPDEFEAWSGQASVPYDQQLLSASDCQTDGWQKKLGTVRVDQIRLNFQLFVRSPAGLPTFSDIALEELADRTILDIMPRLQAIKNGARILEKLNGSTFVECFVPLESDCSVSATDRVPRPLLSGLPESMEDKGLTGDRLFLEMQQKASLEQRQTSVLLDVSGAGKTRMMYEALCHRFGFYFVGCNSDNGGSSDLPRRALSLIAYAETHRESERRTVIEQQFQLLIWWRIQLYQRIKQVFEAITPKQWLLMQAYPVPTLGADIFWKLPIPMNSPPTDLPERITQSLAGQYTPLFLDEAQQLPTLRSFPARNGGGPGSDNTRRILSPLVSAVEAIPQLLMAIAGTGLSLKSIPEVSSPIGGRDKNPNLEIRNLGGFYTHEDIRQCVLRFGFEELSQNEECIQFLFDRLRGRHRFLVTLLTDLSTSPRKDFATLKQLCWQQIQLLCDPNATRGLGQRISELRYPSDTENHTKEELRAGFDQLTRLVHYFRYYSLPHPQASTKAFLLEYALCRFETQETSEKVSIDEPLVVLAYLNNMQSMILDTDLHQSFARSETSSERGFRTEFVTLQPFLIALANNGKKPFSALFPATSQAASSSDTVQQPSIEHNTFPALLNWSVLVKGLGGIVDAVDEKGHQLPWALVLPPCLSKVNQAQDSILSSGSYDICAYLQDQNRPTAFFPHSIAGPDKVMILQFVLYSGHDDDDDNEPNKPEVVASIDVVVFIQDKSGASLSRTDVKTELEKLDPSTFYRGSGQKYTRFRKELLTEIDTNFGGRWLGLLILANQPAPLPQNFIVTPNGKGMAIAITHSQFIASNLLECLGVSEVQCQRESPLVLDSLSAATSR